jgi:hypothetical protein
MYAVKRALLAEDVNETGGAAMLNIKMSSTAEVDYAQPGSCVDIMSENLN